MLVIVSDAASIKLSWIFKARFQIKLREFAATGTPSGVVTGSFGKHLDDARFCEDSARDAVFHI